jgi:hypothetical protein
MGQSLQILAGVVETPLRGAALSSVQVAAGGNKLEGGPA